MDSQDVSGGQQGLRFSAPVEKCPYYPAAVATLHPTLFSPPINRVIFVGLVGSPAESVQAESKLYVSPDGSHQKRGPPVVSSL
jgi:hypothetical protein